MPGISVFQYKGYITHFTYCPRYYKNLMNLELFPFYGIQTYQALYIKNNQARY